MASSVPQAGDRDYAIEYDRRDGYLRAFVSGPADSVEISLAYWTEAADECRRLGYSRLLVCEHLGKAGPTIEYFLVGCELPLILRGIRVAFVDAAAEELEANRLGEIVASNRGADTRLFVDETSAVRWLTSA